MAGCRAVSGGTEQGASGESGRVPSQRLVHGLALKELGSDGENTIGHAEFLSKERGKQSN